MPLMPTHRDQFVLRLSLPESMQVCADAVVTLGWRIIEQSANRLKCAEVKTQLLSFTWPVHVEIVLRAETSSATQATLSGSTFGLGSQQSGYLQEQVQHLRHTIEQAASRQTVRPPETTQQEEQSRTVTTLASELEKLAKLHASGALSEEEFQLAKQQLLEQRAHQTRPAQAAPSGRRVIINGLPLNDERLRLLEEQFQVRIADGAYWYDKVSGAWGRQGGPTLGFTQPHMELGGPLRADASQGNTGVFINGRELHQLDVAALMQLTPNVLRGRYWVDARGVGGYEGGPPIFDLRALAQAAGGVRGGAWSYTSSSGGTAGGDNEGFSFFIDKDTSWTSGD